MAKTAPYIKSIASEIFLERKAQGLSQTQLATIAGVSLNFMSQLEGGKHSVRLDKVCAVLEALGLEIRLVYRRSGGRQKT